MEDNKLDRIKTKEKIKDEVYLFQINLCIKLMYCDILLKKMYSLKGNHNSSGVAST